MSLSTINCIASYPSVKRGNLDTAEATEAEVEDVLRTAIEGQKRVKDQLLRIDSTYPEVRFAYEGKDGQEKLVHTLEEDEYPNQYHRRLPIEGQTQPAEAKINRVSGH